MAVAETPERERIRRCDERGCVASEEDSKGNWISWRFLYYSTTPNLEIRPELGGKFLGNRAFIKSISANETTKLRKIIKNSGGRIQKTREKGKDGKMGWRGTWDG